MSAPRRLPSPRLRRRLAAWLGGGLLCTALAVLGSAAWAPLPARLTTPPSPVWTWSDGTVAHSALAPDDRWRAAVGLDRVDPAYLEALLTLEDARFHHHPGVDPLAVLRAAWSNLTQGRVVSGASTLTMQLVRMVEPRPRTLRSKVIEAWRALGLELRMDKRALLEAYLTFVPYGGNVEGVASASHALFGHGPAHLTPAEIGVLLAIPQSPTARRPQPDHTARLTAARNDILRRLAAQAALPVAPGETPEAVLADALAEPVPTRLASPPRHLGHVAAHLGPATSPDRRRTTSLDEGLQALAGRILARHAPARRREGIHDAAILVVELDTSRIRAALGGHDFHADRPGAQIPAFAVPRSPGSTLKPWLYALAIDRGLALPGHLVRDVPLTWGAYQPDNYDGGFSGLVRLEEALSRSLNLPFVDLLDRIGVESFLGPLGQAGVTSLDPTPGTYGLSAAIGGLELTPLELAGLYSVLAGDGRVRPLSWSPGPADPPGPALVGPGAAWHTRHALRLRERPDFPRRADVAALSPRIAWKTGTSYGHRDAWAIGFDDEHLAVVWMGNLDQSPSAHLVGSEAAGAVLFDLLEALVPRDRAPLDAPPPEDLAAVEVCRLSGHLAGPACPHTTTALAPRHATPPSRCALHVHVEVDLATGLAVTPACRGDRPTEEVAVLRWPPEVRRWLTARRGTLPEHPAWAPGCTPPHATTPPRILHPAPHTAVVLSPGRPAHEQQVALEAAVDRPTDDLSWFIDGTWLGRVPADQTLWWTPEPGTHEVVVVDGTGASARRRLVVHRPTDRPDRSPGHGALEMPAR